MTARAAFEDKLYKSPIPAEAEEKAWLFLLTLLTKEITVSVNTCNIIKQIRSTNRQLITSARNLTLAVQEFFFRFLFFFN